MALSATHLADTSALARLTDPTVRSRLGPLLVEGLVATCAIVDLEVGYSARNADVHARVARERAALPLAEIDEAVLARAREVQGRLAATDQHRLPIPDLVIAAAAERAGLTVLHYDADYDRIAEVTDQATEWVAPRGTL